VTLYRLGHAIRGADAATLQSLVDWPAVREGIKEDICDMVLDQPPDERSGSGLPPFGASFVRGIANNAIDKAVTAEGLVAAARASSSPPTPQPRGAEVRVEWAFFNGPTGFTVSLSAPGQLEPIRLQMVMRNAEWKVRRVWLPPELLENANPRT